MIKINVAEIRRHLTGMKRLQFDAEPAELEIAETELPVAGKVRIDGEISNVGEVLLLKARVSAKVTYPSAGRSVYARREGSSACRRR